MADHFRTGFVLFITLFVLLISYGSIPAASDEYSGVLVKVDITNSYIVIMNPKSGGRFRFSITEKTAILENEASKDVADLKAGTPVIIEYDLSGENYIARRVLIQQAEE
jgi:hypothetical protein